MAETQLPVQDVGPALATALTEEQPHAADYPTWLGFDATGWVAIAMLILIGIMIWKRVPQLIGGALDAKVARIRAELDEAQRLRIEAENLLADYQRQQAEASRDAEAIVAHARSEAKQLVDDARRQTEELIARRARRRRYGLRPCGCAAADELRGRAAELSVEAARRVIASQADATTQATLTDRAISELDRRLH